jgi:hypothetical protein
MPYMVLAALVMSGFLSAAEVKDPAAATGADQKAALACFQAFLDGLGKRDKAAMLSQVFTSSPCNRQVDVARGFGLVKYPLRGLHVIRGLGKEDVGHKGLRVAIVEREPARLDLHHDPVAGQEYMVGIR